MCATHTSCYYSRATFSSRLTVRLLFKDGKYLRGGPIEEMRYVSLYTVILKTSLNCTFPSIDSRYMPTNHLDTQCASSTGKTTRYCWYTCVCNPVFVTPAYPNFVHTVSIARINSALFSRHSSLKFHASVQRGFKKNAIYMSLTNSNLI